jgi:hypothetical protein
MPGLSVQYRTHCFESGLNIDSRKQNGLYASTVHFFLADGDLQQRE